MKKLINVAWFLPLLLLTACNDNTDLQEWFPDEYHKILYILESGNTDVTVYDTGADNVYTLTICKAGSNPALEADVRMETVPQSEIDKEYTENEGIPYKVIPKDAYKFEPAELHFGPSETVKKVNILIDPDRLAAAFAEPVAEPDTRWLLPVIVTSDNDSVNAEKDAYTMFLHNEVVTPQVGFKKHGVHAFTYDYTSGVFTDSVAFGQLAIENIWDITADITVDAGYVAQYNSANGTGYELPAGYTVDKSVALAAGMQEAKVGLSFDLQGRKSGYFMLPVRISQVSRFELPEEAALYAPAIRLVGKRFDRTGWTASACSEETTGEGDTGRAQDVLDGNHGNFWHTSWQSGPFCDHSDGSHHQIIIDSKTERTFTQVGICQRDNNDWGHCVQNYKVWVSTDNQNWTEAGLGTASVGAWEFISDITPAKGRYVKIEFLDSRRGDGAINVSEIYFYGEE